MTREEIIRETSAFLAEGHRNFVSEKVAMSPKSVGLEIFQAPIFGFAAADDPFFMDLRKPEAIGPHFLLPEEWQPGAKTVIGFFLPFTEAVRSPNRESMDWPSEEWLHGRIEGQALLNEVTAFLQNKLKEAGYPSVAPSMDQRFWSQQSLPPGEEGLEYTSNWSERHVAYGCGLGTFGLSKGLITNKGVAGRFSSVITTLALPTDKRPYTGLYDYCVMCGACARNCPADAISLKEGKKHPPCSAFLDDIRSKCSPYYGCGKCQVKVPCEARNPASRS